MLRLTSRIPRQFSRVICSCLVLVFALFCCAAGQIVVSEVAAGPPPEWQVSPLIVRGVEVADIPGAKFLRFDLSFWRSRDDFLFWAQVSLPGE